MTTLAWYKRPAYIASCAALIFALAASTVAANTVINGSRLDDQGEVLEAIEKNQAGVDELVAFVRDLQEQPDDDTNAQVVQQIFRLLCASEDPVRLAACAELEGNFP